MRLQIRLVRARLRAPFVSSRGRVHTVPLGLVSVLGDDGQAGHGEAVALDVGQDELRAALEDCRPALAESDPSQDRDAVLAACAEAAVLPQAVAAIDLALWDLAGRRAEQPVWRLLGAVSAPPLEVNATIAAPDRAQAAADAALARERGFRCLKLKVGLGDDAGRLAAVRAAAGPEMAVRLDANGAWSGPEAVANLRALAPARIELCEEPSSGLEAIAGVAVEAPVPVALDESAALPGALDRQVCQAVCLKIASCGGISGVLSAAARARAAGYRVYLASMLDGPLGIAAALHAAAVVRPDHPCGLATLRLFEGRDDPLPPISGRIATPAGPGLGGGLREWYAY